MNALRTFLAGILLTLAISGCSIFDDKEVKICPNGGFCCRHVPEGGGQGTSYCVNSCSECKSDGSGTAICPEDAINVSKGCQGDHADLGWHKYLASLEFATMSSKPTIHDATPLQGSSISLSFNASSNTLAPLAGYSPLVKRIEASNDPLDCKKECDGGTANCERATLNSPQANEVKTLFERVSNIKTGELSRLELIRMFGISAEQDPCIRGDTKFAGGKVINAADQSCTVGTRFTLPSSKIVTLGFEIPATLIGHWYVDESELHVAFSDIPAENVPSIVSDWAELENNFGGSLLTLDADKSWIRVQTTKGCIAVQY